MNHKQLVQRMNEMQAELESLQSKVAAYENVETEITAAPATNSRRRLLKRMALGAGAFAAVASAGIFSGQQQVLAVTDSDNAIDATGGPNGYGVKASSNFAQLALVPATGTGAPAAASGQHSAGEFFVDSTGALYYCVTGGTPGTWRKLTSATSGNSGSLQLLATPVRVVNTLANPGVGGVTGPYSGLKIFTIAGSNGIPNEATGILGVAAAYAPRFLSGAGFTQNGNLTLFGADVANATVPNINSVAFSSPQTFSSSQVVSALKNGKLGINVYAGSSGETTSHVVLDIVGYYA